MKFDNNKAKKTAVKNLFPSMKDAKWKTWYNSGLIITDLGDYSFSLECIRDGVWGVRDIIVPTERNKKYYVSMDYTDAETYIWGFKSYDGLTYVDNTTNQVMNPAYNKTNTSFVATSEYTAIRFGRRHMGTSIISNYQIEQGEAVTAFEPYKEINKSSKKIYVSDNIDSIPLLDGARGYGTTVSIDKSVVYNGKLMNRIEVTDITGSQAKYGGTNFNAVAGKTYYLQTILFDPTNLYRYSAIYDTNVGGVIPNVFTGGQSAKITDLGEGYKLLEAKFTATATGALTHGWIHYVTVGQNYRMWFGEVTVQENTEVKYGSTSKKATLATGKNIFDKNTMSLELGALDGSSGGYYKDPLVYVMRTGFIPVKPNTTYVYNKPSGNYINVAPYAYDSIKQYLGSANRPAVQPVTLNDLALRFTTPSNCYFVKLQLNRNDINAVLSQDELNSYGEILQLEEGILSTVYEGYNFGNKISKQYELAPKKNMIPTDVYSWDLGTLTSGANSDSTRRLRLKSSLKIEQNVLYTLTFDNTYDMSISSYASNGGWIRESAWASSPITFTTGDTSTIRMIIRRKDGEVMTLSELDIIKPQFEKGLATAFESYEVVKKKSNYYDVKVPYKKYPFNFQRESVEVLDGVQYGYNTPRIKDDGILAEEGTINLLFNKNLSPNAPATVKDLGDRYLVTAGTTGDYGGGYFAGMVVKGNTTYTLSAKFVESDSAKGKLDFVIEQSSGNKDRYKPIKKDDRYYITFTTSSTTDRLTVCFYMKGANIGDSYEMWKNIQLEEKAYPTSPTVYERKIESVSIPTNVFDAQGFTVELDVKATVNPALYPAYFKPLSVYTSTGDSLGITNAQGATTIYAEMKSNSVNKGSGAVTYSPLEWNNFKVVYDGTKFSFYLNGVLMGSNTHTPMTGTITDVALGGYKASKFNGIYKNVVIKDRNGKVTFSI